MTAATASQVWTSMNVSFEPGVADVTAARLLGMFDSARRDVAVRVTGSEGSGVGYDQLQLDSTAIAAVEPGDVVTVSAFLVAATPKRHQVLYVATCVGGVTDGCARTSVLAEAVGWTLSPVIATERVTEATVPRAASDERMAYRS